MRLMLQGIKSGHVFIHETKINCRKEAIEAGAVPALCSVLGTGDDEPVSIEVLKALYTIIAPDGTGKLEQTQLILMRRQHTNHTMGTPVQCSLLLAVPIETCEGHMGRL